MKCWVKIDNSICIIHVDLAILHVERSLLCRRQSRICSFEWSFECEYLLLHTHIVFGDCLHDCIISFFYLVSDPTPHHSWSGYVCFLFILIFLWYLRHSRFILFCSSCLKINITHEMMWTLWVLLLCFREKRCSHLFSYWYFSS